MGLDNAKDGKLLYHLTNLKNMESIISEGLVPRRYLKEHNIRFEDVANPQIIEKRTSRRLDNYTPFHFHPYSAFDVAVKNTYPDEEFVYICIKRALAQFNDFKILIKHPLSQNDCRIYDYTEGIGLIDWNTMRTAGATDEYAKNVKMAECITEKIIPAELFHCVYVSNMETKKCIEALFCENGLTEPPPYVDIQKMWF